LSPSRRNILLFIISITTCLIFVEVIFSTLFRYGIIAPTPSISIQEEIQETVFFDPVRGYRLTSKPARWARITYGEIEYCDTLRGNNEGFPDEDDFFPARSDDTTYRYAVLGDSFSSAQFMRRNWPDRAEDSMNNNGQQWELLNFSVSGAGLANWWSILFHHIQTQEYELDGIIFAVYDDPLRGDLYRGFTGADRRESIAYFFQLSNWDPATWPKSYEEALPYFGVLPIYILNHDRFQSTLDGDWRPDLPRPWRFYATRRLLSLLNKPDTTPPPQPHVFRDEMKALALEIATYCRNHNLKPIVARVPSKESALDFEEPSKDIIEFTSILNAELLDGLKAFEGLSRNEIAQCYYPYDGHWNQKGSDRFAIFMGSELKRISGNIPSDTK
jgi:hypothetical protein